MRLTWTLEAIALILLAASRSAAADDGTFTLYEQFRALADGSFAQLGDLRYDADQSGLPDTKVNPSVRFWSR